MSIPLEIWKFGLLLYLVASKVSQEYSMLILMSFTGSIGLSIPLYPVPFNASATIPLNKLDNKK